MLARPAQDEHRTKKLGAPSETPLATVVATDKCAEERIHKEIKFNDPCMDPVT